MTPLDSNCLIVQIDLISLCQSFYRSDLFEVRLVIVFTFYELLSQCSLPSYTLFQAYFQQVPKSSRVERKVFSPSVVEKGHTLVTFVLLLVLAIDDILIKNKDIDLPPRNIQHSNGKSALFSGKYPSGREV